MYLPYRRQTSRKRFGTTEDVHPFDAHPAVCPHGGYDRLCLEHTYRSIEGWFTFPRLYRRAIRKVPDGGTLVEIGVWKGKSLLFLATESIKSGKDHRIVAIDPWEDDGASVGETADSDAAYADFQRNIAPASERVEVMRTTSLEASREFADESIDFVFVDASHRYEDVLADLETWAPKVRPGGVIAGHDFHWKGVNRAVREFTSSEGLGGPRATELCWVVQIPPDTRPPSERIASILGTPIQFALLKLAALRRLLLRLEDP